MRISDWSSDVCSSDLRPFADRGRGGRILDHAGFEEHAACDHVQPLGERARNRHLDALVARRPDPRIAAGRIITEIGPAQVERSEEHTSELQSLMRISYAVFCLKKIIIQV